MAEFYSLTSEYSTLWTIVSVVWYALLAAGLWKIFDKAHEAGWKALIPVYNFYNLFKISWNTRSFWGYLIVTALSGIFLVYGNGNSMMFYLGTALSVVSALMLAVLWYNVSLAYGHGLGYFLGLYFLNPVFIMILGFGSSQYIGNRYSTLAHI